MAEYRGHLLRHSCLLYTSGTTFDIHIHFSETSRETFTNKVVRLIKNDSGDETA